MRPSKILTAVSLAVVWVPYIGGCIFEWDWMLALAFGVVNLIVTALILWPYRRRQVPQSLVDMRDWHAICEARRQMARRRPWLRGPLKSLWTFSFYRVEGTMAAGPVYRWKTRADRRIEKSLRQCCGVPGGQRCPSHEEHR